MLRYVLITLSLALAGCAAGDSRLATQDIVYQKANTQVLAVYNLHRSWFANVSSGYLNRSDERYGEFGGKLRLCSDADYHCLIGGIGVALPKKLSGQRKWEFQGNRCESALPLAADASATIVCVSGEWSTRFVYSPAQGITSYENAAEPGFEYRLVDPKGLFAE